MMNEDLLVLLMKMMIRSNLTNYQDHHQNLCRHMDDDDFFVVLDYNDTVMNVSNSWWMSDVD